MLTQYSTRFQIWLYSFYVTLALALSSCSVIKGIFKAGFWAAIILIVAVVGLVFWAMRRTRRNP